MPMNIDVATGKVSADKAQTRRFVEARILAEVVARNSKEGSPDAAFWAGLSCDLKRAALEVGAKYLDSDGHLVETPKQKAVNDSAPG